MSDTRRDVLNADRASNAEVPRSGAVAHQLNEAARERASAAAKSGQAGDWHRERAWTRLGVARHGDGADKEHRLDRMTAGERAVERNHAATRARGEGARVQEGERLARQMSGEAHKARAMEAWAGLRDAKRAEAQEAQKQTATDYWAAKIARGAEQSGRAQAQTREHKEGARRGVRMGAG